MENLNTVVFTGGDGVWSDKEAQVTIEGFEVTYFKTSNNDYIGELKVYFDTSNWRVEEDGLIYTDATFLVNLREELDDIGLDADDLWYSEQGMQGQDFVSFDVGDNFIESYIQQYEKKLQES